LLDFGQNGLKWRSLAFRGWQKSRRISVQQNLLHVLFSYFIKVNLRNNLPSEFLKRSKKIFRQEEEISPHSVDKQAKISESKKVFFS
jgi:hypothetical protein